MAGLDAPYVVPLGVAAALPAHDLANTYLAVVRQGRYWLVDCADSPIPRLQRAGLDPLAVQGVILTHFHPDHIYGLPAYLIGLCLLSIERGGMPGPIRFYARPEVMASLRQLIAIFEPQGWMGRLSLEYHEIQPEVGARVAEHEDFTITAAPGCHSVPSLAVRFVVPRGGPAFVYSSDTGPCPAIEMLATGASLLFHEATDYPAPHSRPEDAGQLAERAGVERLVLIHYVADPGKLDQLVARARKAFHGPVELAEEFRRYFWTSFENL